MRPRLGLWVALLAAAALLAVGGGGGVAAAEEAYVTLLYGDEFVLGVRVLGKSIRDTGTRRDLVALVSDGVSEYSRKLLEVCASVCSSVREFSTVLRAFPLPPAPRNAQPACAQLDHSVVENEHLHLEFLHNSREKRPTSPVPAQPEQQIVSCFSKILNSSQEKQKPEVDHLSTDLF
jgi:hypothetical protein